MSGIYLNGVGMPEKGTLRVIIHSDGMALIDCGPVYEEAEALIVPDHGDLIDSEVLLSKIQKWYWEALETVKRMPAVIPAERSEE